jgi:hypothetical protein
VLEAVDVLLEATDVVLKARPEPPLPHAPSRPAAIIAASAGVRRRLVAGSGRDIERCCVVAPR